MIHDQAHELRHLVRQRSRIGAAGTQAVPLVVVHGGKGGVGATTIAANLAVALARQGRRVVFADVDLDHGGTTNFALAQPAGSVLDVLAGRRTMHEVLERGPAGILVLAGAWASGEPTSFSLPAQDRFICDLKNLTPYADVVVIDTGSSRGQLVRRFWSEADVHLVVSTTEAAAIMEAYAAIKVLLTAQAPAALHTLVNRATDPTDARHVHDRIALACEKFLGRRTNTLGHVEVCEAGSAVEPVLIFPARSPAARSLDRVADTLWAQLQLDASKRQRQAISA